jgi:hypothetical protein
MELGQARPVEFLLPQGEGGRRPDEGENPGGFLVVAATLSPNI